MGGRTRKRKPAAPPAWLVVGAKVDYCSVIGRAPTQRGMIVRAGPELASSGDWVVWLVGKPGWVVVEACLPAGYDVAAARAVIAAAREETGDSWTLGELYNTRTGGPVVDVLTEPDGAPIFEVCMPESAKAAVAAFDPHAGWSAALDEIERLRRELEEACRG